MQPSKEREADDGDPLDDLDDLLDDDLREEGGADGAGANAASGADVAGAEDATSGTDAPARGDTGGGRIGMDGRWFSAKALLFAVLILGVAVVAGGMVPVVGGTLGSATGVFVGAFLLGLVASTRRYVETGIAGAGFGALSAVSGVLGVGFLPIGVSYLQQWGLTLLAVGGGAGLLLALLGHYFGRDLRDGLTGGVPE
ncbi:hypothetical protein JCM17823_26990 [Halorubrum gandharaense]